MNIMNCLIIDICTHNPFITTVKVAAELDITVLINLSNRNIILHEFLLQLQSIFNGTKINYGQSHPILGFNKNFNGLDIMV